MSTKRDCPHKVDCTMRAQGWCNLLPVWYQTKDGKVIGCTKPVMREKLIEKHLVGVPVERWSRIPPFRDCLCEVTEVTDAI